MRRLVRYWHNVNGLMTIPDLLGITGFWLYRGTLRRTVSVAVAMAALVVVGEKFKVEHALTGTGLILLLSCVGGALLMALGGSFARSQLTLSEAKGANLLEDMKKDRADLHMDQLWRHVFRYEQARFTEDELAGEARLIEEHRRDLNRVCLPEPSKRLSEGRLGEVMEILRQLGRTEEGWRYVFQYGIQVPMPRSMLRHRLRYDLSKVKDWYDGAPFHSTDCKLVEQFNGSENLQRVKKEVGLTWRQMLPFTHKRIWQGMWFRMVIRAIQLRIGAACRALDEKYPACHFAPDQFLWPTEASHALIRQAAGQAALDDLFHYRRQIFHRVFSPELELAHALMHKTIYPSFEVASLLRRRYDPEYLLGELGETWAEDVRRYDRAFKETERGEALRREIVKEAERTRDALSAFLDERGGVFDRKDAEAARAVRIAAHVNRDGLREILLEGANGEAARKVERIIHEAAEQKRRYTTRLLAVRTHHELTRIELEDYEFYLERILNEDVEAWGKDGE